MYVAVGILALALMIFSVMNLFDNAGLYDKPKANNSYTRCLEMIKADNAKEVCGYISTGSK